jgi:uncharacterized membrane protein YqiK
MFVELLIVSIVIGIGTLFIGCYYYIRKNKDRIIRFLNDPFTIRKY